MAKLSIPISGFSSVTDTVPALYEAQYPEDFDDWMEIRDISQKAAAPLWTPGVYKEGKERAKKNTWKNVQEVTAIVLDYDGKPPVSIERAVEVWGDFDFIIHTTARHTTEKPCFRVVFPLDRPAQVPDEFERVRQAMWLLGEAKGVSWDASTRDAGRMYFLPTRLEGNANEAVFLHNEGMVLPVDALLEIQMQLDPGFTPKHGSKAAAGTGAGSPIDIPQGAQGTGMFSGVEKAHQTEHWDRIVEQCQFAKHAVEDAETLTEPEWYAALSLVARCRNGDNIAHEISKPYPNYDPEETSDKYKRATDDTGPFTCEHIKDLCDACDGCPITDITSPIQLGRLDPETATPEELARDARQRAEAKVLQNEEWVRAARERQATLQTEEARLRASLKFLQNYSGDDEQVAETAGELATVRDQLSDAKAETKQAEKALKRSRNSARYTSDEGGADPTTFEGLRLSMSTGAPIASKYNLIHILSSDPVYTDYFQYDDFHEKVSYGGSLAEDHMDTAICADIERRYGIAAQTAMFRESAIVEAKKNRIHPVREYLESLEWDGVFRLEELMVKGFGATSTEEGYLEEAGVKMCISAVARIMCPGCKVDTMLVLLGAQGAGKSKALRALSNGWFADTIISLGNKDAMQALNGTWFYEIAELDSFKKAEHSRIKAFITSQTDKYRPPYGHHPIERPRQTILVGSTNEREFLDDPSGSRRFVPVAIGEVDVAWILANLDQLWAEAKVRYDRGDSWWYEGDSHDRLARVSQAYLSDDPWEPLIRRWCKVAGRKKRYVTVAEALTDGLMLGLNQVNRQAKIRVSAILRGMGCTESRPIIDGGRVRVFNLPEELLDEIDSNVVPMPWNPGRVGGGK